MHLFFFFPFKYLQCPGSDMTMVPPNACYLPPYTSSLFRLHLFLLPHNIWFYFLVPTEVDSLSFSALNARRGSIESRRDTVFLLSFFLLVSLRLLREYSALSALRFAWRTKIE